MTNFEAQVAFMPPQFFPAGVEMPPHASSVFRLLRHGLADIDSILTLNLLRGPGT